MFRTRALAAGCAAVSLLAFAAPTMAKPDAADGVSPFTRDVFVIVGSTLRNPTDTTADDANLFNNAGVNLGLTWGQFRSATATSRTQQLGGAKNPRTDARIELAGLVPDGLYSLFYITLGPDSENPLCPGVERALPLTGSFVADANGSASIHARVSGALLGAQQLFYEVIYHAYGQSYGDLPNAGEFLTQGPNCRSSFGEDSMRQLIISQKS